MYILDGINWPSDFRDLLDELTSGYELDIQSYDFRDSMRERGYIRGGVMRGWVATEKLMAEHSDIEKAIEEVEAKYDPNGWKPNSEFPEKDYEFGQIEVWYPSHSAAYPVSYESKDNGFYNLYERLIDVGFSHWRVVVPPKGIRQ